MLLTRFNLARSPELRRPPEWVPNVHLDRRWLEGRVELFERVCAPSVHAQTACGFLWIVLVDPHSPDWLLERLREIAPDVDLASASGFRAEDDFRDAVRARLGDGVWLTSRVDSDDALARDFMERAQQHATDGYLAFPEGAVLDLRIGHVSAKRDEENAFLTRQAYGATVLEVANNLAQPLLVDGPAAWLQVVHGGNVWNWFSDERPQSATWARERFEVAPGLIAPGGLRARRVAALAKRWAPAWTKPWLRALRDRARRVLG